MHIVSVLVPCMFIAACLIADFSFASAEGCFSRRTADSQKPYIITNWPLGADLPWLVSTFHFLSNLFTFAKITLIVTCSI